MKAVAVGVYMITVGFVVVFPHHPRFVRALFIAQMGVA
jgi:hypothetical protein